MSNNKRQNEQQPGFDVSDIYFVLFRQKRIILACAAAGILAAGALFIIRPAQYESVAELYIQYITDTKPIKQSADDVWVKSPEPGGNSIIINETKFLTSLDMAQEVVARVGATKILAKAGGGSDTNAAAALILKRLTPEYVQNSSIVRIMFQHPDADIARTVLSEIIDAYITKSADMHKPVGVSREVLIKETKRLRENLEVTEKELQDAKNEVGIVSTMEDWKKNWETELDRIRQELNKAEVELAGHRAALGEVQRLSTTNSDTTNHTASAEAPPPEVLKEYQITCDVRDQAWTEYRNALANFKPESEMVRKAIEKRDRFESEKKKLEMLYPQLADMAVPAPKAGGDVSAPFLNLRAESNEVMRLAAATNILQMQLAKIRAEQAAVERKAPLLRELETKREIQIASLKRFVDTQVTQQVAGGGNESEGIKINESPTPAVKTRSKKFKKFVAMVLGGGIGGGLALAFLIEMVLDRSIRRPGEIETKLHLPLFISIPDMNGNGHGKSGLLLAARNRLLLKEANGEALVPVGRVPAGEAGAGVNSPYEPGNELQRYYGGLRDRLIVNFEVRNLNHNPKLVGVTSCSRGAGVSSTAAGLAASLSETGDGNVLLVNMNGEEGSAQQFYKGRPGCGLDDALASETRNNAFVQDNLYVATENGEAENTKKTLPKRFATLMPKLKTSDYDYIIFDMPPVSQTSATARLSGLMDMVLLVIESEKTSKDSVVRATKLLTESKANISTVLNKVHSYVPAQLHRDFLD